MFELLYKHLLDLKLGNSLSVGITVCVTLSFLAFVSWINLLLAKKYLGRVASKILARNPLPWVDLGKKYGIFKKIHYLIPGLIVHMGCSALAPIGHLGFVMAAILGLASKIYLAMLFTLLLGSLINVLLDIYERLEVAKSQPIRFYVQGFKIVLFMASGIIILSILLDKDPSVFLTGLGAAMAILLVVFKDVILGFLSTLQITLYDVARVGDWVSIPSFGVDGTIDQISITALRIQNFDKSISTVPTSALLTSGVKNWRGMKESGGRRIKRSINIDMQSIVFCSRSMLEHFSQIPILKKPLESHILSYAPESSNLNTLTTPTVTDPKAFSFQALTDNALTNLGVFRLYIEAYLSNHEKVHRNAFTFLIRQLQSTEYGLPLEIYVFINETEVSAYEAAQSQIFEHIIAASRDFGLSIFQNSYTQESSIPLPSSLTAPILEEALKEHPPLKKTPR